MELDLDKAVVDDDLLRKLCFETPPYRMLTTGDENVDRLASAIERGNFVGDEYCVACRRVTPFRRMMLTSSGGGAGSRLTTLRTPVSKHQRVTVHCTRCQGTYVFLFGPYRGGLAKIGQSPSMADIASADIQRFASELDDSDMSELRHATMLQSHKIGVAAFVYLRRIFERLLERHRLEQEANSGPIEGYDAMRVEERVKALEAVLPAELVANRKIYAILSKGIHELDEDTCLDFYPVVRAAIVEILERDIAARNQAVASSALRAAVADLAGKL